MSFISYYSNYRKVVFCVIFLAVFLSLLLSVCYAHVDVLSPDLAREIAEREYQRKWEESHKYDFSDGGHGWERLREKKQKEKK